MRIGIDAMGGDFAPGVVVKGALAALDKIGDDTTLVLYGASDAIGQYMPSDSPIEVVHCGEVIQMCDHPLKAFQSKPDSSIVVGFKHLLAGKIDGFASAGSTGAMMIGSMQVVGVIDGVIRPTIATHFVNTVGGKVTLLDVGLNADCKPEVLSQYGVMGSIYSSAVCGVDNPRVALLNIGSEDSKGNLIAKATFPLLKERTSINFVGNVEGKHILDGQVADVIVCDGFMGNIMLKFLESIYDTLKPAGVNLPYVDSMNYEVVGGTPVLGVNKVVVIGHGASSELAITGMITQTERSVERDLVGKFKAAFAGENKN